jgi:hypothetical protein
VTLRPRQQRAGRRWVVLLATVALISSVFGGIALAVNNTGAFELEGNALTDSGAGAPDDWDRVCYQVTFSAEKKNGASDADAAQAATAKCTADVGTTGAIAVSWIDAQASPTIFTGGGSKDPQDISSWLWKPKDTVPDKDTIRHGFAARYSLTSSANCPGPGGDTSGATKCEVVFFGMDRFANDGDAQLGFWFFQNPIGLTNTASQGGFKFSGVHREGDLLLISNFSNGGSTSTISAYFWDTTCTKAANNDPQPTQCAAANLRLQAKSTAANCSSSAATAAFCGIVNPTNGTAAPWSYTDKKGNSTYLQGEFYEGGVNLSALGIGDECFSSIAAESRASTSPTSVLKDFVLGGFGECGSSTVTTPSDNSNEPITTNPTIPANGTLLVKDKAVVTVSGVQTFGGSVAFHLCGPLDLAPTTGVTQTECKTGGTKIGSDKTVSGPSPATVFSDAATITKAGKYCWRAVYSGDASKGVPGSSDDSATECFTVDPRQSTLSTQAIDANGANVTSAVPQGTAVYDKATLGNTANKPGTGGPGPGDPSINPTTAGGVATGTITFKLYGPGTTTTACNTIAAGFDTAYPNGIVVNVSGNGDYTTIGSPFTPASPGIYHWKAEYSGDSPNTLGTTHNSGCTETSERVEILQLEPTLTTRQFVYPQDSVKIEVGAGGGNLAGNVRFTLHDDLGECQSRTDIKYDSSNIAVSGASPQIKVTNNTTYRIVDGTTHYWNVSYASTNAAHTGASSVCTESTAVTFGGNDATITLP